MSERVEHTEEAEIRALLEGRRIVSAEGATLTLDDGTIVRVVPNEGCGGCASGWYELKHLAAVDNIITAVNLHDDPDSADPERHTYRLAVVADAVEINAAIVEGDDGNGYYGTGYGLLVERPAAPDGKEPKPS